MESTSASLLEQLRSPDSESAWNRFVELYSPLIFYWGRERNLQPADASDLVQDVLTQLAMQLPSFRYDPQRSFRGLLKRIVINRAINLQRRSRLQPLTGHEADLLTAAADDEGLFAETEYRGQVARQMLLLLRAEMGERVWQAGWMQIVEGKNAQEVAAELKLSVNAAYIAKSRVLQRLRKQLVDLTE